MRESDENLCFFEKEKGKGWKDDMERAMNKNNDWEHNVDMKWSRRSSRLCMQR